MSVYASPAGTLAKSYLTDKRPSIVARYRRSKLSYDAMPVSALKLLAPMTVNVEPSHLRAPRRRLESRTAPRIFTVPEKGLVRSWTHWSKPDPMAALVCAPQVLGAVKVL